MPKLLFMIGSWLLSSALKRILIGAGVGLFASKFITSIIQKYIDKGINTFDTQGTATSHVIYMLGLSGADTALGILVGALLARASIEASKIGLRKIT